MYSCLWEVYWLNGMKKYIVELVGKCLNCQQVKVEHHNLGGLSENISISTWKLEDLNMKFFTSVSLTCQQFDQIRVILDRMTNLTHFFLVKISLSLEDYANLYIREMVSFHIVPLSIIFSQGTLFPSQFWNPFQIGLGTQVKLRTTFHSKTDRKVQHTIQTLKDILRSCHFKKNWDHHLPLIKFTFNNSYHSRNWNDIV